MPRPWRKAFPGAKYHVTSRGNGRERIFCADAERKRFVEQLQTCLDRDRVVLYAYALMPNHYHLLVGTPEGNLQAFMQRLNTAYGMYFRYRRHRPGHCFQGRYGARLVEGDDYILRLTRYIHLNPVKLDTMKRRSPEYRRMYLMRYPWSSLRGYLDNKDREDFVDYRWMDLMHRASQGAMRKAYRAYVIACLEKKDPVMLEAYGKSEYAIGDDEFVEAVEQEMRKQAAAAARRSDVRWPQETRPTFEDAVVMISRDYGVSRSELRRRGRGVGEARSFLIELACSVCGMTQRAAAEAMGVSEHAVGKQRQRLSKKLQSDKRLRARLRDLRALAT